eukprot:Phypoly_transcript_07356.p1 GENE.Phypoly_transcript_07356~~Phypoly_transcript_07356.p1  ORF type:complete len:504 (+),score=69.11 Phypoly_transcript_07356:108-1619(+)
MSDASSASRSYFWGHVSMTEKAPLLRTSQIAQNHKEKTKSKWPGVSLVLLVLLFSETARGIIMPTLAPYVTSLGGDAVILGYAVSAFSAGRFVSTIVLGYLSTTLSYKAVLTGSLIVSVAGNLMYGFSYLWGPYVLITSRILTGIGAGTLSVQRAYIAQVTNEQERTAYMSFLGAVQFFGLGVTPGLGAIIIYLPDFEVGNIVFNKFTVPGHLLAVLSLLVLLLLFFFFKNPPPTQKPMENEKPTEPTPNLESAKIGVQATYEPPKTACGASTPEFTTFENNFPTPTSESMATFLPVPTPEPSTLSKAQKILVFAVFLGLNFMVRLVLGIIETLGTPLYMDLHGGPPSNGHSQTRKEIEAGSLFGTMGLIGMAVLFLLSYLSKWVSDMKILVAGLVGLVVGMSLLIGNLDLIRFIVGCGFVWSIGYPLAQTLIISMFSKLLGGKPQGTWMGWIGAMGSAGRIVGPIVAGVLWDTFGQSATMIFGSVFACLSLFTAFMLVCIRR